MFEMPVCTAVRRQQAGLEKNPYFACPASTGGRIDGIEATQTVNKPYVNFKILASACAVARSDKNKSKLVTYVFSKALFGAFSSLAELQTEKDSMAEGSARPGTSLVR